MTQHQEYSGAASPQHTQLHSRHQWHRGLDCMVHLLYSDKQTVRRHTVSYYYISISKLSCVDIYNMQKWCKLNYQPGILEILIKYEGLTRELWSCTVMQVWLTFWSAFSLSSSLTLLFSRLVVVAASSFSSCISFFSSASTSSLA